MLKVAFLDRDGVINHDYGYVHKKEDFVLHDNVVEALQLLRDNNYKIIIVTNQAGIAKEKFSLKQYESLTQWYLQKFEKEGIKILDVFYCPYHVDGTIKKYKIDSFYRKPKPGMFLKAISKYNIDTTKSFTVGDKLSDLQASISAKIYRNFLITSNDKEQFGDLKISKAKNLFEAVKVVTNS